MYASARTHDEPDAAPDPGAIRREARVRLRRSGYSSLRDLSCEVRGGHVILGGELSSFYLKQVAQAAVADVAGVCNVVNQIRVTRKVRPGPPAGSRGPVSSSEGARAR